MNESPDLWVELRYQHRNIAELINDHPDKATDEVLRMLNEGLNLDIDIPHPSPVVYNESEQLLSN